MTNPNRLSNISASFGHIHFDRWLPEDFKHDVNWRTEQIEKGMAMDLGFSAASKYADLRHPSATLVFITGSYATGKPTPISDVDVYVVSEIAQIPVRDYAIVSGFPIQATIQNSLSIYESLNNSINAKEMGIIPAICAGKFIRGSSHTFEKIKQIASKTIDIEHEIDQLSINYYTMKLVCHYLKIFRDLDILDRADEIFKLVRCAGDLIQSRQGALKTGQAQYEQNLRESSLYSRLINSVADAVRGDVDDFMHATQSIITSDGDPSWASEDYRLLPLQL